MAANSTPVKPPRTAKPGGLLDQWTLLAEIIADRRSRKPHIQIAQIVIDRQKDEHGNGRASVRYIERGTGLSKWRISKATADLVEWGYFTRRPGIGTRPSEFTPSWPSVRVQRGTTPPLLVSESGGTGCPSLEGHYGALVSESGGTNPAYVDGLQAGLRKAESSVGAATPPDAAGLAAASPETPPGREGEPFTELWNAFNLKLTNTKQKAKAAYDKLSPDAGLRTLMIEAAAKLHAHYEEHGVERRYRIQLQNWINARGWEDDLPIVYTDAQSAAISKVRGSAKAKPGKAAPAGTTTVTITRADVIRGATRTELHLAGEGFEHVVTVDAEDDAERTKGHEKLAQIVTAAGLERIADSSELLGRRINVVRMAKGVVEFTRPEPPVEAAPPEPEQRPAEPPEPAHPAEPAPPHPAEPAPKPAPRQKKPKPQIEQREIPKDREGRLAMLERWRRNGFFDDGDVA